MQSQKEREETLSAKGWEMGGLISLAKLTLGVEIKFNLLAKIWLSSY